MSRSPERREGCAMSITMSPSAIKHVRTFLESRGKSGGLRLGVKTSGCSGLAYVLEVFENADDNDEVFDIEGIKVAIDRKSLVYLDGTELDYTREGLNEGFKFINPNEKNSCGCGESFSV